MAPTARGLVTPARWNPSVRVFSCTSVRFGEIPAAPRPIRSPHVLERPDATGQSVS
jgi:hypothetical protein